MLPTHNWKSDTTRKVAAEVNNMLTLMDWAKPIVDLRPELRGSIVSLEAELKALDSFLAPKEAQREGLGRVIEELGDRLEDSREINRVWRQVAEVFCQSHGVEFDGKDPDAMLILAGECRDQS